MNPDIFVGAVTNQGKREHGTPLTPSLSRREKCCKGRREKLGRRKARARGATGKGSGGAAHRCLGGLAAQAVPHACWQALHARRSFALAFYGCWVLRAGVNKWGRECLMRVHAGVLITRQFCPRCLGAECASAHEHVTAIVRATQLFQLSRGRRGRASRLPGGSGRGHVKIIVGWCELGCGCPGKCR